MSMSEFFAMNGYAFYVWGSYGVTLLVFVVEILLVRHRRSNVLRELRLIREDEAGEESGERT